MIPDMDSQLEQARDFFMAGISDYEAGRFENAERNFLASLSLMPGRVSTLTNLGAARLKLGRFEDAAQVLDEALRKEPDNLEALGHRATALAELGQAGEALQLLDRLLSLAAGNAAAWTLRGTLLRELHRAEEAAQSYRSALAHGADRELMAYYLAALQPGGLAGPPPATAPRHYVQSLFDGYADGFEDHLVDVLQYRAPQMLADGLDAPGRRFDRALDLGCGTGLCGVLLRPLAGHLTGVDLSGNMVRQAKARGVYDDVVESDIAEYLAGAGQLFDLVVAADVFIYVGALEAVFEGAARAIRPGGVFCFSVEREDSQVLALRPSRRYAHSRRYVEALAAKNGFGISAMAEHPIRNDQGSPIDGLFVWLVKS